jgi:hypothetical protein
LSFPQQPVHRGPGYACEPEPELIAFGRISLPAEWPEERRMRFLNRWIATALNAPVTEAEEFGLGGIT